ncbi:hypothetical protein KUCAC02_030532, partial [Chaenocephalus aceratus]
SVLAQERRDGGGVGGEPRRKKHSSYKLAETKSRWTERAPSDMRSGLIVAYITAHTHYPGIKISETNLLTLMLDTHTELDLSQPLGPLLCKLRGTLSGDNDCHL